MEFRHLQTFVTVGALLSFRRAAKCLHLTQSTVSSQIRSLEESLGVSLFHRLGRSIALTVAGERLMVQARALLDLREETRAGVTSGGQAPCTLRIRMPQSLAMKYLPSVLVKFQDRFPLAGVDVGDCAFAELPDELRAGLIDAAFLLADTVPFSHVAVQLLKEVDLVAVRAKSMQFSGAKCMEWSDFAGFRLFLPLHDCSYKMKLEAELTARGIRPQAVVRVNSMHTLLRCVEKGLGVALIPQFCLGEFTPGTVAKMGFQDEDLQTGILLLTHAKKTFSRELAFFLELCRNYMA